MAESPLEEKQLVYPAPAVSRQTSTLTKNDDFGDCVQVAVRIRPQMPREIAEGASNCIRVPDPNVPQVSVDESDKAFTYDFAFDNDKGQSVIYDNTVRRLVEGCFNGFNATVLAYGQTGAGKTFTMGTGFETQQVDFDEADNTVGLVPRALRHIFSKELDFSTPVPSEQAAGDPAAATTLPSQTSITNFTLGISFMELYNEQLRDLLSRYTSNDNPIIPTAISANQHLKIVENHHGEMEIPNLTRLAVDSYEDTMRALRDGALKRTTAATQMNATSSRSHAIFTLHIECTKLIQSTTTDPETGEVKEESDEQNVKAKFHFVDLAGSERLKKTGATGARLKEGVNINYGLLVLGNVISALGDPKRKGTHVPYRDSKLTRILQDSLGGNSRTLMIACVSPSDSEFVETLSTLKYANRARNIKNKVIQNQDSASKQIKMLRDRIQSLQQEVDEWRSGKRALGEDGMDSMNDMYEENRMLQKENDGFRKKLTVQKVTIDDQKRRLVDLQGRNFQIGDGDNAGTVEGVVLSYLDQIEDLRAKLIEANAENDRLNKVIHGQIRGPDYNAATCRQRPATAQSMHEDSMKDHLSILEAAKEEVKQRRLTVGVGKGKGVSSRSATSLETQDNTSGIEDGNMSSDPPSPVQRPPELLTIDDITKPDEIIKPPTPLPLEEINEEDPFAEEELQLVNDQIAQKEALIRALEESMQHQHELKESFDAQLEDLRIKMVALEAEKNRELKKIEDKYKKSNKKSAAPAGEVRAIQNNYENKVKTYQKEIASLKTMKREHERQSVKHKHQAASLDRAKGEISHMKKQRATLIRQAREQQRLNQRAQLERQKQLQKVQSNLSKLQAKSKRVETDLARKNMVLQAQNASMQADLKKLKNEKMSHKVQGKQKFGSSRVREQKSLETKFRVKYQNFTKELEGYVERKRDRLALEARLNKLANERVSLINEKRQRDKLKNSELSSGELETTISLDATLNQALEEDGDNLMDAIKIKTSQIRNIRKDLMELDEADEPIVSFEANNQLVGQFSTEEYRYLTIEIYKSMVEGIDERIVAEFEKKSVQYELDKEKTKHQEHSEFIDLLVMNHDSMSTPAIIQPKSRKARRSDRYALQTDFTTPTKTAPEPSPGPTDSSMYFTAPTNDANPMSRENTFVIGPSNTGLDGNFTRPLPPPPATTNRPPSAVASAPNLDLLETTFTIGAIEDRTVSNPSLSNSSDPAAITEELTSRAGKSVFSRLHKTIHTPKSKTGVFERVKKSAALKRNLTKIDKLYTARGHDRSVQCLKMVGTGNKFLASGSKDRNVKVWDVDKFTEKGTLAGHATNINALEWIPHCQRLVSASGHCAHLWDLRSEQCTAMLMSSGVVSANPFAPALYRASNERPPNEYDIGALHAFGDYYLLVSANQAIYLWDIRQSNGAIGTLSTIKETICFTSNSSHVFVGDKFHNIKSYDRGKLTALSSAEIESDDDELPQINLNHKFKPPHFDGVTSLLATDASMYSVSKDGNMKHWDLLMRKQYTQKYKIHGGDWCTSIAWLDYGERTGCDRLITSVGRDKCVRVWSQETLELVGEVKQAHDDSINCVETHGQYIYTASDDKNINIFVSLI